MLQRRRRRWVVLLIIFLLDISGKLKQCTSEASTQEQQQFIDEKLVAPMDSSETSRRFRILADAPTPPTTSPSGLQYFCVAMLDADQNSLQDGLNWACGAGMANCTAIQPGGECYQPNNLTGLASYAYNDYYQRTRADGGNCYFNNTAEITTIDPSYGSCIFTGSSNVNTGINSSFTLSPPAFGGGLSPPFSLNSSAPELHILQMPQYLFLVFLLLFLLSAQITSINYDLLSS